MRKAMTATKQLPVDHDPSTDAGLHEQEERHPGNPAAIAVTDGEGVGIVLHRNRHLGRQGAAADLLQWHLSPADDRRKRDNSFRPDMRRRTDDEQIIVRSQGLVTQDVAQAFWIYEEACRQGLGVDLEPAIASQAGAPLF